MIPNDIKEIAYIAWKAAANAHRLYPDNKHTFSDYWASSQSEFEKFNLYQLAQEELTKKDERIKELETTLRKAYILIEEMENSSTTK